MNKISYLSWAAGDLGITFSMRKGRISIFRKTLDEIQFPEYYHFLFNTSEKTFAIQVCGMDDEGAHRLIVDLGKKFRCEVNCTSLVRFVYQTCGWDSNSSYRILGTPSPDQQLVKFDLKSAQKTDGMRLQFRRIGTGKIVPVKFPAM